MPFTVAISGDSIVNRRLSVCAEAGFLALVTVFRGADVAFTHLETLIHDFEGPELYPAAEAGGTWMRSPAFVAEELKWAGFDIVSLASNHALDYAYGGLFATCSALKRAGMFYAGAGHNLGEARAPTYLDAAPARVALLSMTTSFTAWSRAGDARPDMKGRPGINPLGYSYAVDRPTLASITDLGRRLGWWVTQTGTDEWLLNPPGLHNTLYRFVESDQPGVTPVLDREDADANLRAIRGARQQADCVIVHVHSHEWNPNRGLSTPAAFLPPFARACIDAGADVFVGEGSHAPLRGIEIYKGKPIFYDPGDLFRMSNSVERLPADFFLKYRQQLSPTSIYEASPAEGLAAKRQRLYRDPVSPPGGYLTAPVRGIVVPVCSFDSRMQLTGIALYPATWTEGPSSRSGIPLLASGEHGRAIIEYLQSLCTPFGTCLAYDGGVGSVTLT